MSEVATDSTNIIDPEEMVVIEKGEDVFPQEEDMVEMTMDEPEMTQEEQARARGDFVEEPGASEQEESIADESASEQESEGEEGENQETEEAPEEKQEDTLDDGAQGNQSPVETVPYGRFAKKVSDLKSAKETIDSLQRKIELLENGESSPPEQQEQQAPSNHAESSSVDDKRKAITKKTSQYNEALVDGDLELADELSAEINTLREDIATERALETVKRDAYQGQVETVVNDVVDRNEQYFSDPVNVSVFNAAREAIMQRDGISFIDAIRETEKLLIPGAAGQQPAAGKREEVLAKQKKESVKRNADAANRQPPRVDAGQGLRRERPVKSNSVFSMSDREYQDLPDAEKRKLRGDVVM